MLLGLTALSSWGSGEWPYCGFGLTESGVIHGCDRVWYDSEFHLRWSHGLETFRDLAFCLEGFIVPNETLTWGQVRALYR